MREAVMSSSQTSLLIPQQNTSEMQFYKKLFYIH